MSRYFHKSSGRLRDFRELVTHLRNNRAKKIDHVYVSVHGCPRGAGEIEVIRKIIDEKGKRKTEEIIDENKEAGYFLKELAQALSWDHSIRPARLPLFAEVPATVTTYNGDSGFLEIKQGDIYEQTQPISYIPETCQKLGEE